MKASVRTILIPAATCVFLAIILVKSGAFSSEPESSQQQLPDTLEAKANIPPTMLELGSEGCIPCEKMKPVMAALEDKYGEKISIEFYDIRKDPTMANKYGIRLIPTQIFLSSDGAEFFRHEGFFEEVEIEKVFVQMEVIL